MTTAYSAMALLLESRAGSIRGGTSSCPREVALKLSSFYSVGRQQVTGVRNRRTQQQLDVDMWPEESGKGRERTEGLTAQAGRLWRG